MAKTNQEEVQTDRRRTKTDRRQADPDAAKPRVERRKVQRRRQIDPTTCERDYSREEVEFMQALDTYKRRSGRMFPTCSEILEVIRDLGYVRVESESESESESAVGLTAGEENPAAEGEREPGEQLTSPAGEFTSLDADASDVEPADCEAEAEAEVTSAASQY